MALWVLEATARAPIRLPRGPLHQVRAAHRVRRYTDFGPAVVHTFLVETLFGASDPATRTVVEGLIPPGDRAWDVDAKPAPDGVYPDLETRGAVVVMGGAVVRVHED